MLSFDAGPLQASISQQAGHIQLAGPDLDIAIRVAIRAGMSIGIAARPPLHTSDAAGARDREYYLEQVMPLFWEPTVDFVGEIEGCDRDEFPGAAAALLFPVRRPEAFGLVMVEALACGAPVIALNSGSVPEVVKDGVTGFVRNTEDELLEAIGRIGNIDRKQCRDDAEKRLSVMAVADAYERIYAQLVGSMSATLRR